MESAYYSSLIKPFFAPPAWMFGPVWTVLYIMIAIAGGYLVHLKATGKISWWPLIVFGTNIVFNVLFTPVQFGLKSNLLATLVVSLVLGTLIWFEVLIYSKSRFVFWLLMPYLLWVVFATILQTSILFLNM